MTRPMRSVMKHQFGQIPRADIPRSTIDRSSGHKSTFDSGYLIPFFWDEALPGDFFQTKVAAFARMATPIFPVMDNMRMSFFFFDVPMRLLWDNWAKFNGEQKNPGDSTDFTIPTMSAPAGGYTIGSLHDYFGLPTGIANIKHSALPLRAYQLVRDEWFRDQNLQSSSTLSTGDGPDDPANAVLYRRGKRADYFTSCLPFPQKGQAVPLPLGGTAPVKGDGTSLIGVRAIGQFDSNLATQLGTPNVLHAAGNAAASVGLAFTETQGLFTDLAEATGTTVNTMRQAFQLQRLLERDARGGTRLTEIVLSHFGVVSPDARLNRPEYLGGGTIPIVVNSVAQTSSTDQTTPQGNLAAFATASGSGIGFSKAFTEHSIVLGLVQISADLTYQQGLERAWSRETRFDFYWPALSHIGEQAVLSKEIYADGTSADDDVFGYQGRYDEYRYKPSRISGKFRSTAADSLDAWHLSQHFQTRPTLSDTFIQDTPPVKRALAVQNQPEFIFDSYIQHKCTRPLPLFGVPGLIDHF